MKEPTTAFWVVVALDGAIAVPSVGGCSVAMTKGVVFHDRSRAVKFLKAHGRPQRCADTSPYALLPKLKLYRAEPA